MTPSARLQAAIEILEQLQATNQPADRLLKDWFRSRRFAGSKDRAAISETIFSILRRFYGLSWRLQSRHPRRLVLAHLLESALPVDEIDVLFNGGTYAPASLTNEERQHLTQAIEAAPQSVQGEYPEFLQSALERGFGDDLLPEMQALCARAPVDLRVNHLKADRNSVMAQLRSDGFDVQPTLYAPYGLRLPSGHGLSGLSQHPLFIDGAFEFQDEAAQIAAHLACARPHERVLDLAAGAGGKSLALAADMNGQGELIACDIDGKRLSGLAPRALRAGLSNIRPHLLQNGPPRGTFDLVFVDAPCTGTGIWRRQPELRVRLTPARIRELEDVQRRLLDQAASYLKPGGRVVYATCSILPSENEDQVQAFLSRHPGYKVKNPFALWQGPTEPPNARDDFFRATPYSTQTDGFFAAVLMPE